MATVIWKINGLSAASYELVNLVLTKRNQQADTFSFVHDGALFDSDLLFAHDADITLTRVEGVDTVVWFKGKIRETPRVGTAGAESISYVAYGAWNILERRAYLQDYSEAVDPSLADSALTLKARGRVVLGQSSGGDKVTLEAALIGAIALAGLTPNVSLGAVTVPYDEATDYSCADVVTRMLQWAPDAVVWFDYTTTPITCKIRRREDLTAVDLAVEGGVIGAGGIRINPRYDLVVNHVALIYIATNRENSSSWETTTRAVYPPGTTGTEDNALVRTIRLAGSVADSSNLEQVVNVDPIPPALDTTALVTTGATYDSLLNFWKKKEPWLIGATITVKGFRAGSRKRVPLPDEENQSTTPTEDLKELVAPGALTDWMIEEDESLLVERQTVGVQVAYEIKDNDDETKVQRKRKTLTSTIVATNAQSKTYSILESSSYTAAEEIPAGLELVLYNALHPLHWDGTIELQERECSRILDMGNVGNLTGSRAEWTAMNALVQSVQWNLDTGTTSLQVGPPKQLGIDSLVEIYKSNRNRQPVTSNYSRATGSSAAQRRQSLPTWQPVSPAQSGTDVAARAFTAALSVAGQVPTAGEITTAIETVYTGDDTPIFGDTIALTVGGTEKFRARVSSTGTPSGLFTVSFTVSTVTYYAQVVQTGIYP